MRPAAAGPGAAERRLRVALSGGVPDRVPVLPKIWVDLAAALMGTDLRDVLEDPLAALQVIARAALSVGADAARQFHFPARRTAGRDGKLCEVDDRGAVVGRIDLDGGLATLLDDARAFRIEDPACMAYHQHRTSDEPFVRSVADARRIAVPDRRILRELGWAQRQQAVIDEVADRICLIGDCGSATLAFAALMRGLHRALVDLIDDPPLVHAIMEKGAAIAVERGALALQQGIKVLRLNDSAANMSVISPAHWREFVLPHMRDVCTELHAGDPEALVYCHICGNVLPVIEDLLETGIDCIGPLDPLGGFTAAEARGRVGDRAALMGGVDTQSFTRRGPTDVLQEARRCIAGAGGRGGFVLGSGCVIPRTAPRANLEALAAAADRYGRYAGGALADPDAR